MREAENHFATGFKLLLLLPILPRPSFKRQITVSRNVAQFGNGLSEIETNASDLQRSNDQSTMSAPSTFPDQSLTIVGRRSYLPVATPS